jgi:hypothetical protein
MSLEIIQFNGPICNERALKIDMWEIMFCPYVSMWAWGKEEQVAGFDLEFDLPCKVICNIYYSLA